MNQASERIAFEAYMLSLGWTPLYARDGVYQSESVQGRWEAWQARASRDDTLAQVYDAFGIGEQARTPSVLMECVRNTIKFAQMLNAVEREFFMVPGEPDDEHPESQPDDECLVNRWASTVPEYIRQFRAALATRAARETAPNERVVQYREASTALSLHELAQELAIAAKLGGNFTISAGVCAMLYKAMTAPPSVATYAGVDCSRYTIEWTNGPLPEGTAFYAVPFVATPAPRVPDHVLREVVNKLRDVALEFHETGQLRERLRRALDPLLNPAPAREKGVDLDLLPPLGIRNDRDMLAYLMQAFDNEFGNCERCGHAEPTKNMDSANFLRQYLAATSARAEQQ